MVVSVLAKLEAEPVSMALMTPVPETNHCTTLRKKKTHASSFLTYLLVGGSGNGGYSKLTIIAICVDEVTSSGLRCLDIINTRREGEGLSRHIQRSETGVSRMLSTPIHLWFLYYYTSITGSS